jgi:DNA-binding transcriptional LysR family regulator
MNPIDVLDDRSVDTRLLEYFVAVAEERSFTRAADRVLASQSTVSAGIRSLERTLGAELFDRSTRVVELTDAGEAALPGARRAIDGVARVRDVVAADGVDLRGRLRIGTFISLDVVDLPDLLGAFHRRHPLVDLQLVASPAGSTGLAEDVRLRRADLAFSGLPRRELVDLHSVELLRSPFVAVLPEDHRLAGRAGLALADLAPERWIDAPAGYASRIALDRWFERAGMRRAISAEVADAAEMPRLVAAGFGITVLPELIRRAAPGVVAVRVDDGGLEFAVSAITRRRPSAAARAFLALLAERFGDRGAAPAPPAGGSR